MREFETSLGAFVMFRPQTVRDNERLARLIVKLSADNAAEFNRLVGNHVDFDIVHHIEVDVDRQFAFRGFPIQHNGIMPIAVGA